ncbi:hypothetical protein J6590_079146 [Homalodisca vitripennis]|nr:hypothetical protein J6590_079146 [Homalodisca vitripennis]
MQALENIPQYRLYDDIYATQGYVGSTLKKPMSGSCSVRKSIPACRNDKRGLSHPTLIDQNSAPSPSTPTGNPGAALGFKVQNLKLSTSNIFQLSGGARVIKNKGARIRVNFTGQDTTHLYLWSLVVAVAERRARAIWCGSAESKWKGGGGLVVGRRRTLIKSGRRKRFILTPAMASTVNPSSLFDLAKKIVVEQFSNNGRAIMSLEVPRTVRDALIEEHKQTDCVYVTFEKKSVGRVGVSCKPSKEKGRDIIGSWSDNQLSLDRLLYLSNA